MEDVDSTMERRREIVLQRLQKRRQQPCSTGRREREGREEELEKLLEEAKMELEMQSATALMEQRLVEFLSLNVAGRDAVKVRAVLSQIRRAILDKETQQKQPFSFEKVARVPESERDEEAAGVSESSDETSSERRPPASEDSQTFKATSSKHDQTSSNGLSEEGGTCKEETQKVSVMNESDWDATIQGREGSSVLVRDCSKLWLSFTFFPSTVQLFGVRDSTLLFLPIHTSLFINNCQRVTVFAASQQVRVHESVDCSLHVYASAAVVLEGCSRMKIAPYKATQDGKTLVVQQSGKLDWKNVKDFDWLAEEASPNWQVLPETEWGTADINSRQIK